MKILDIKIKGFRSLSDIHISNLGPINVFFGDNNSGKSNLLDALELAFNVNQKDLPISAYYREQLPAFVDNFTINADRTISKELSIIIKLNIEKNDIERLHATKEILDSAKIYKANKNQTLILHFGLSPISNQEANKKLISAVINNVQMYDSTKTQPDSFFPSFISTIGPDDRQKAAEETLLYTIGAFNKINTGRWITSEDSVNGVHYEFPINIFKAWLRTMIESRGQHFETFRKIQRWFNGKPFNYGIIRPVVSNGYTDILISDPTGRELLIERLGTGVQQCLILLSQIASRVDEYNAKMLGIEELELNLSPHMQKEFLQVLFTIVKDPALSGIGQIFLTTHSPYLCDRDRAELFAVSLQEDKTTVIDHGEESTRRMIKHFKYDDLNLQRRSQLKT